MLASRSFPWASFSPSAASYTPSSKHSPITPAHLFSQNSSKSTVSKNMTRPSPHSDISGLMSSINYSLQAQSSISSIRLAIIIFVTITQRAILCFVIAFDEGSFDNPSKSALSQNQHATNPYFLCPTWIIQHLAQSSASSLILLRLRSDFPAARHGVNQRWQSLLLTHSTTLTIFSNSDILCQWRFNWTCVSCQYLSCSLSHTNPSSLTPSDFRPGACPS